jgi:hypothetical protein
MAQSMLNMRAEETPVPVPNELEGVLTAEGFASLRAAVERADAFLSNRDDWDAWCDAVIGDYCTKELPYETQPMEVDDQRTYVALSADDDAKVRAWLAQQYKVVAITIEEEPRPGPSGTQQKQAKKRPMIDPETPIKTHEDLEAATRSIIRSKQRSTNWSVRITGDRHSLDTIVERLQERNDILAMRGQIEQGSSAKDPHIQMIIRMSASCNYATVEKLMMELRDGLKGIRLHQMKWVPVTSPDHIANLLEYVWKLETAVAGTRFSTGDYESETTTKSNNRKGKDLRKASAMTLIAALGPTQAEIQWAEWKRSKKDFEETLEEYNWQVKMNRRKKMRTEMQTMVTSLYPWQKYL